MNSQRRTKRSKATKQQTIVCITAIIALTILEGIALWKGIDGQLFALTLAAIAGIAGFNLKSALQGGK